MTEPNDDDKPEKRGVSFRIYPDRKKEWDDAVKAHPEVDTLTGLVKTAIHHEQKRIEGETVGPQAQQAPAPEVDDLRDDVAAMNDEISRLAREVAGLRDQLEPDPDFEELKTDVFALLPTKRELDGFSVTGLGEGYEPEENIERRRTKLEGDAPLDRERDEWLAKSGRPDVFARLLAVRRDMVTDALTDLKGDMPAIVHSTEKDGYTVYYMEE